MTAPPRGLAALLALAVYAVGAAGLLAWPALHDPRTSYIGLGNDPEIFIWSLRWWPHALADGVNPLHTTALWAPDGLNLAWTTSVPSAALALAPVTLAAGPVAAYDLAVTLGPLLAAFCAYLLCRRLTGRFWPSLAGGWTFGFSSYVLGQSLGHLHVELVFLVPLAALLVVRWLDGSLGSRALVLWLAVLLAVQLGLSTEVTLTLTMAGAGALGLAAWLEPALRPRLRRLARLLAAAYALAAVLASPLLLSALLHFETGTINSPFRFSADPLNLVLPTRLTLLGGEAAGTLTDRMRGNVAENGAYLGIGLLAALALYLWHERGSPRGRYLRWALGVTVLASLGPVLFVLGQPLLPLPWLPLAYLPPFEHILPVRLSAYTALLAGVAVASWLSLPGRSGPRWALVLAGLVLVLPDAGSDLWRAEAPTPAFFTDGSSHRLLAPGETVLTLPLAKVGHAMLWHARDGLRFRQADGYLRPDPPAALADDPLVAALWVDEPQNATAADLERFVRARGVGAVVLDEAAAPRYAPLVAGLGPPQRVGGVLLYRTGAAGAGS